MPELTILNQYRLNDTAAHFTAAIAALAARVESSGEPGVLSYRFFVSEAVPVAHAVIDYATPQAWIGHHDRSCFGPRCRRCTALQRLTKSPFLGL